MHDIFTSDGSTDLPKMKGMLVMPLFVPMQVPPVAGFLLLATSLSYERLQVCFAATCLVSLSLSVRAQAALQSGRSAAAEAPSLR